MGSEYFRRLGRQIEELWFCVNREEEALPDIAAEILAQQPPLDHFDREQIIDDLLSGRESRPRELTPTGTFGQPGMTLYYGHGFVIDLYFWLNCLPSIHNHPFCGTFTILQGYSLHTKYEWREMEQLGSGIAIGQLHSISTDLLKEGETSQFSLLRYPLIHRLLHVPKPALSLVIRSIRTVGYLRYYPPSLAVSMSTIDDHLARQLSMLDTLRECKDPSFERRFASFIETSDFEMAFLAISRAYTDYHTPADFDRLLEPVRKRHGSHADALFSPIENAAWTSAQDNQRATFEHEEDRLLTSIMMCAQSREQALNLVGLCFDDGEPVEVLKSWIDTAPLYDPDDKAARLMSKLVVEGQTTTEIENHLASISDDPHQIRKQRALIVEHCESGLFRSLLKV